MKKALLVMASLAVAVLSVSCGKGNKDNAVNSGSSAEVTLKGTDGEKLVALFDSEAAKSGFDLEKGAALMTEKVLGDYSCVSAPVSEGWVEGFDADVTGFCNAICFRPMIGSIPLLCYIFESSDAKALEEHLKKNANPMWNICTAAKETVSSVQGNFVLFAMLPGEEDF